MAFHDIGKGNISRHFSIVKITFSWLFKKGKKYALQWKYA
jgi:hypothetical protein